VTFERQRAVTIEEAIDLKNLLARLDEHVVAAAEASDAKLFKKKSASP
jgi:hypothetical protein